MGWTATLLIAVCIYIAVRIILKKTNVGGRDPKNDKECRVVYLLGDEIGYIRTLDRGKEKIMTYRQLARRYNLGSLDCDRVVSQMILKLEKDCYGGAEIPGMKKVIIDQIRDEQTRRKLENELKKMKQSGGKYDYAGETYETIFMEDLFK
jgi:hypothetical protein